ncbi:ribonuclease H family protein [Carnobacterium maltaromaticum]|uniref:ribonuclease H n=1 Tax=Carnobacterium maltaromaticum TaxID=2751 RepID=A0AAW9K6M3_CARML|nr:ribonuclease H family protein [Carnobacterium maltaromaticum]MDZ5759854.1 ribonuclease H family protein [Carnobacterium maltaromaticum]
MKKENHYAIKKGFSPGIYQRWEDVKEQVEGFSNAQYKKFSTLEEAEAYMNGVPVPSPTVIPIQNATTPDCLLYVDGSFNQTKKQYGWGYVAVQNGVSIYKKYGKGNNPAYLSSHQIGGEVAAVLQGLDYAIYKKFQSVEIHYDYSGIENWATGVWNAKKQISQAYKFLYDQKSSNISVTFVKVQAHSGNYFNTVADNLAKRGANL